jgi:hypothetical protein
MNRYKTAAVPTKIYSDRDDFQFHISYFWMELFRVKYLVGFIFHSLLAFPEVVTIFKTSKNRTFT